MNFEQALIMMKNKYEMTNPRVNGYFSINKNGFYYYGNDIDEDYLIEINGRECALGVDMISNDDISESNDWEEYKLGTPNILTYGEQSYLNNVLKPFKNGITYLMLNNDINDRFYLFINIIGDNRWNDFITLPQIGNLMYKGMKLGRHYTPEELNLFKGKY